MVKNKKYINTKINYRPEIDGLRAISVFAVIFYHSEAELFDRAFFPGGFFGVDIFFVISGYLITSLILKELIFYKQFSFLNFYERRVRRIIPALLTVILFFSGIAWLYLLPIDLVNYSKSILYTLGFSSNIYFYFSEIIYNAQDSLLKPFLHTWSLSVEEQYYIIFPICLILLFKYFKNYLLFFLTIGLLISLIVADVSSKNNASITFYFLHTRMWELLFGSILAYLEIKKKYTSNQKPFKKFYVFFGLGLIFYSFFFLNDKILHPSLISIIPIIGVGLIIWFADKKNFLIQILSSKIFVGTGLISYSLYLWHFPIFSFAKLTGFTEGDLLKKLFLIIITIIFSKISYSLIEKKFRNRKIISTKTLINYVSVSCFFIVIFNLLIVKNDGFKSRLPEILKSDSGIEYSWKKLKNEKGETCWKKFDSYCTFNKSGKKNIYILGDSHMGSIAPNLKKKLINENYQVNIILFGGCWYLPGFSKYEATGALDKSCSSKNQNKIKNILLNSQDSIIIIGGRLPLYLSSKYFDNQEGGVERRIQGSDFGYFKSNNNSSLKDTISNSIYELLNSNHKIILLYPIPEVGLHVPKKIHSNWIRRFFSNEYKKPISTSYEVYESRTFESFELLNSIKHNNLFRVYPHKLFCNTAIKDRCVANNKNFIYYSDDDHPSTIGSKLINDLILKKLREIVKNN